MKSLNNLLLMLACLAFISVIGGAIYEHLAVVPQWSAAPPASLSMFQGRYGLLAGIFWQTIHPLAIGSFIAALIVNWKSKRRSLILWALGGYVLILMVTAAYFVPELIAITTTPYQQAVSADLQSRAAWWEKLSLARLLLLISLAGLLLSSLTIPTHRVGLQSSTN